MMCVFFFLFVLFLCVYSITSRNNGQISNVGGGFRCISEYPWYIIEVKSKHFSNNRKKMTEKREFSRKTSFRFFYMVVTCN
ncbi:Uncharacterized protein FWK35_00011745 [Aphis craccivora]|uniref:Secreted protein n=1 Tax=Aphis craccivora TaxID=307492 RepID=A0A6G0YZJ1_APHCR|nr:Uncharacterized protein FWK35_00011745 [Aphis craccivora]